jgi:hypothetical protein
MLAIVSKLAREELRQRARTFHDPVLVQPVEDFPSHFCCGEVAGEFVRKCMSEDLAASSAALSIAQRICW